MIMNPKSAKLSIPMIGVSLMVLGVFCSLPQINDVSAKAEGVAAALKRVDGCLILPEGRLKEGEVYATYQVAPTPKGGDPNQVYRQEQQIGDGQSICDLGGGTAQTKGSAAMFYRAADYKEFRKAMAKRLGVEQIEGQPFAQAKAADVDPSLHIHQAIAWRPDYSKRVRAVPVHQKNIFEQLFTPQNK
jgi:hypothetical protein